MLEWRGTTEKAIEHVEKYVLEYAEDGKEHDKLMRSSDLAAIRHLVEKAKDA